MRNEPILQAVHADIESHSKEMKRMIIRRAELNDADAIAKVEAECFPESEAATLTQFHERLKYYASHFWLMFDSEKLIAFVDGPVTDDRDLTDEMYAHAEMHNESGKWQMIFGVNTIPAYRRRGHAEELLRCMINDAREQNRHGLVLTCKEKLIHYYAKLGFVNEGESESSHGGAKWYQMRLTFHE